VTSVAGERYLGLDFGTLSVRALVADARGAVVGSAVAPYASGQIVRGGGDAGRFADALPAAWALQDPDDWLAAAGTAVRSALAAGDVDPAAVASLGLDFTSCTVLPALADGTPLARTGLNDRPHAWPKLWKHHGAQRQASELTAVARARAEPWLDRYGGAVGLEWSFPKLLEVLDDDPAVADATEVWLEGGDWVVWQLTGAPALGGDRTAADLVRSTCQAGYKALWSPAGGYPSSAYLEAVRPGLGSLADRVLGGTHRAPGRPAGDVSPAGAERLGLRPGVPVSAAVIDAHAGVPGVGVSGTGTLVLVLGTSGCHMIMDAAEHPIPGVAGVVADGILPGSFGYETGQAAVGDAFEWARRLAGGGDHRELEAAARAVPPGAEGLCAVDWFHGCRTPLMDGDLTGALLGVTLHHGPAHLYRAVLEASACGLAWIVDTLRAGGVAVDRFVATGGLPQQNALFGEIVAGVLGAPVEMSRVEHGSALGAAILGALAARHFATAAEAVDAMAGGASAQPPPAVIEPDPGAVEAYRAVIRRYRAAADLLAGATGLATQAHHDLPPASEPDGRASRTAPPQPTSAYQPTPPTAPRQPTSPYHPVPPAGPTRPAPTDPVLAPDTRPVETP
jgi:L-ribulokinase